jgi:hypothetical protein
MFTKSDNHQKIRFNIFRAINGSLDIINMMIEKFQLENSKINFRYDSSTPDCIEFVFFNGAHSCETDDVDDANIKPVAFLEGHGCISCKEPAGMNYHSNTVIKVTVDKLNAIQDSLKLLDQISQAEHSAQSTDMAKC